MKKMRRFAAIAAAAMTACMAVPMMTAWAAEPVTTSITVTSDGSTAVAGNYTAYKILDASVEGTNYAYEVNDDFRAILQTAINDADATDTEIIDYIETLSSTTGTATGTMRTFADAVYMAILANTGTYSEGAVLTSTDGTFSTVAQGYYLIAETSVTSPQTRSLVMVGTAGENVLKVTLKKDMPSLIKKVKDANDSNDTTETVNGWQDSADHDFNDTVSFMLEATLPSDYASYKEYKLVFHDDLKGNGVFSDVGITKVYYDANGNRTFDDGDQNITSYETPESVSETHSVNNFTCDFEVVIDNLKTAATNAVADGTIVVEYTAKLTEKAVLGKDGNWNGAYLEYSNNPYYTGNDDTTSNTTEDKVAVYTYKTVINKKDGNDTALPGAEFTLEKWVNGAWKTVAGTIDSTGAVFTFSGLDDGKYKLTESVTPGGYNGIDPIEFEVTAEHDEEADAPTLVSLTGNAADGEITFTPDEAEGSLSADVVNLTGTELPSTGGIGTTLFYVIGGTLAAGAGVALIAKKRMKNEE